MALALDYGLQLALFCPTMQFSARFEHNDEADDEKCRDSTEKLESGARSRENGETTERVEKMMLAEPKKGTRKWAPQESDREAKKIKDREAEERVRQTLGAMLDAYCSLLTNKYGSK